MASSEAHSAKTTTVRGDVHTSRGALQHTTRTTSTNRKTTLSSQVKGTPVAISSRSSSPSNLLPTVDPQPNRSTSLGPTGSAVSLSATQTDGAASKPPDLSEGSRKAVIAVTTIGKCGRGSPRKDLSAHIMLRRCPHHCIPHILDMAHAQGRQILRLGVLRRQSRHHHCNHITRPKDDSIANL